MAPGGSSERSNRQPAPAPADWITDCVLGATPDKVVLFQPQQQWVYSDESHYGNGGCPPYFIVDFKGVLGYTILFNVDLQNSASNEDLCKLFLGELIVFRRAATSRVWKKHAHASFDFAWATDHCEPPQANTIAKVIPATTAGVRVAARVGIKGFFVKPPLKVGALYWT